MARYYEHRSLRVRNRVIKCAHEDLLSDGRCSGSPPPALISEVLRSLCSRSCCLLDQTCHDSWMRDESDMAGVDLTRGRAHTLGVETLEIRIQRVILARHQIPRRNGLTRRRIDRRAEYRIVNRLLCGAYDSCCTFRQIGGEHIVDLITGDVEEASRIGPQRFAERGRILVRE